MCLYITIYAEICKQKSLAISWQKKNSVEGRNAFYAVFFSKR